MFVRVDLIRTAKTMSVVADTAMADVVVGIIMDKKLAFIFPGQGSQSFGMGSEIYQNSNSAKSLLDKASDELKIDFKTLMFEENDKLSLSEFTQPAIVLNSLMLLSEFKNLSNLTPNFYMGHSLGEFSALAAAGALGEIDTIKAVNLRGKFMQEDCDGKGLSMMVVLALPDDIVEEICERARANGKEIFVANYNCDGQVVLAGSKDDLSELEPTIKQVGAKRAMLLDMSVASHSPFLKNASQKLSKFLQTCDFKESFADVVSNATSNKYNTKDEALIVLEKQLVSPVLYKQSIEKYESEIDAFIEFGSGVLASINKKITKKPTISIKDYKSLQDALKRLEEL